MHTLYLNDAARLRGGWAGSPGSAYFHVSVLTLRARANASSLNFMVQLNWTCLHTHGYFNSKSSKQIS